MAEKRSEQRDDEDGRASDPKETGSRPITAPEAARAATEQLTAMLGREPESVVGMTRAEDGWEIEMDVVELRRVPDSTSVIAAYVVRVDGNGDLVSYHRRDSRSRGRV